MKTKNSHLVWLLIKRLDMGFVRSRRKTNQPTNEYTAVNVAVNGCYRGERKGAENGDPVLFIYCLARWCTRGIIIVVHGLWKLRAAGRHFWVNVIDNNLKLYLTR